MKPNIRLIAIILLLSGAGSLTLEMVWSRLLRLVFGSTTLAITTILVAYMFGLGIGALLGGRLAARVKNGIRLYGWIENRLTASPSASCLSGTYTPSLGIKKPGAFRGEGNRDT